MLIFQQAFSQVNFCQSCFFIPQQCYLSCDIENDLSGFYPASTFIPLSDTGQFPSYCGIVSHNILLIVFIAGSESITVSLESSNCVDLLGNPMGLGLQLGLMNNCIIDDCLDLDAGCTSSSLEVSSDDLIVGNQYSIFIDGCNGNSCDFEIDIDHEPFIQNSISSLSAYSLCSETCLTNDDCFSDTDCAFTEAIEVKANETVLFKPRHLGDSNLDFGDLDDPCSFYADNSPGLFTWEFDGQEYEVFPSEDGGVSLELTMPDVTEEYVTELCLEIELCNQNIDQYWTEIIVRPIEVETYFFDVCIEDIENDWKYPSNEGFDPNGDGLEWKGPDRFSLDEVLSWDDNCRSFDVQDDCFDFVQTICIDVFDGVNPEEVTLYMFDCQFDDEEYEWIWPQTQEEYFLEPDFFREHITIFEESLRADWDERHCDTTLTINLETLSVDGILEKIECDEQEGYSIYKFGLDLDELRHEVYKEWPAIDEVYQLEWTFKDSNGNPNVLATVNELRVEEDTEVYIKATYSFLNGAWGAENDVFTEISSCDKVFGPYTLTASCDGDNSICPTFSGTTFTINGVTPSCTNCSILENDIITISIDENLLPDGAEIEWWASTDINFMPQQSGTKVGSSSVTGNWKYGQQYPELLSINYRTEANHSEYFVVGTGSGLLVNDLLIELDDNCDSTCPVECEQELYGSQCEWIKSNKMVLSDCPNVIPVGPGDFVPPNSTVVVFIDEDDAQLIQSAKNLCSEDGCIYVLFNRCERCLDAFSDAGQSTYTIFGSSYSSSLTYIGNADGFSVNNSGDYSDQPDTLQSVNQTLVDLNAVVSDLQLNLSCNDYSGTVYLKGVVVSDNFNTDCCNPYTPTFSFNLECQPTSTELFWTNTNILPSNITINNGQCTTPYVFPNNAWSDGTNTYSYPLDPMAYTTTCAGPISFSSTHTPQSGFTQGSTTVTYRISDGCGNTLSHFFTVEVICDTQPPTPTAEIFDTYPWLANVVDQNNCVGTAITEYDNGNYSFILVETSTSSVLYFQDGVLYCTDSPGFSCVSAYGLDTPSDTWTCTGGPGPGPDPMPTPEIFDDYPFLATIVDPADCEGVVIEFYPFGSSLFPYVIIDDLGVLYSNTGQLYCTSSASFDCVVAYNLSAPEMTWTCGGTPPPTPTGDPIFDNYIWLSNYIDESDCEGDRITVYQSGSFVYLLIESKGETTMYNEDGLFYCQDFGSFSCVDAYGFTSSQIIDTWMCGMQLEEEDLTLRSLKFEELEVSVYPNPSRDVFYLEVEAEEYSLELYNLAGEKVDFQQLPNELSLAQAEPGVYVLRIQAGEMSRVVRLILL